MSMNGLVKSDEERLFIHSTKPLVAYVTTAARKLCRPKSKYLGDCINSVELIHP
jgi:hypothetical protein